MILLYFDTVMAVYNDVYILSRDFSDFVPYLLNKMKEFLSVSFSTLSSGETTVSSTCSWMDDSRSVFGRIRHPR